MSRRVLIETPKEFDDLITETLKIVTLYSDEKGGIVYCLRWVYDMPIYCDKNGTYHVVHGWITYEIPGTVLREYRKYVHDNDISIDFYDTEDVVECCGDVIPSYLSEWILNISNAWSYELLHNNTLILRGGVLDERELNNIRFLTRCNTRLLHIENIEFRKVNVNEPLRGYDEIWGYLLRRVKTIKQIRLYRCEDTFESKLGYSYYNGMDVVRARRDLSVLRTPGELWVSYDDGDDAVKGKFDSYIKEFEPKVDDEDEDNLRRCMRELGYFSGFCNMMSSTLAWRYDLATYSSTRRLAFHATQEGSVCDFIKKMHAENSEIQMVGYEFDEDGLFRMCS